MTLNTPYLNASIVTQASKSQLEKVAGIVLQEKEGVIVDNGRWDYAPPISAILE